jgi:hypothetical protein
MVSFQRGSRSNRHVRAVLSADGEFTEWKKLHKARRRQERHDLDG